MGAKAIVIKDVPADELTNESGLPRSSLAVYEHVHPLQLDHLECEAQVGGTCARCSSDVRAHVPQAGEERFQQGRVLQSSDRRLLGANLKGWW